MKVNERGIWHTSDYNRHRFDEQMCDEIIAIVLEKNLLTSVDLGCGNGYYTKRLMESGLCCQAYDGNPHTEELTEGIGRVLDLSEPINIGSFDLVLSLEVGEHIPEQFENTYLDNICNSANNFVILSWAIVGQGGTGHVNCKPNDWVIDQMSKRGFVVTDDSDRIRKVVKKCKYFRNTILTFEKEKI